MIELIIVLSIISIITLIATPNYLKYRDYVIEEEALTVGKGIYLSAVDCYFINKKSDLKSIKEFIQKDLGSSVISVSNEGSAKESYLEVKYNYNGKEYKCLMDLEKNICEIFYLNSKSESLIYKNY